MTTRDRDDDRATTPSASVETPTYLSPDQEHRAGDDPAQQAAVRRGREQRADDDRRHRADDDRGGEREVDVVEERVPSVADSVSGTDWARSVPTSWSLRRLGIEEDEQHHDERSRARPR